MAREKTAFLPLLFVALSLLVLSVSSESRGAGANEGGTLLVHAAPDIVYTTGTDYVSLFDPTRCEDVVSALPSSDEARVWWVVAAFPPSARPLLAGVSFGISYSHQGVVLIDAGTVAEFELHTEGWPGSFEGTSILFDEVQTEHLLPLYWFAGYQYGSQPAEFRVIANPIHPEAFLDPTFPGFLDEAVAFGSLTLGGEGGIAACPEDLAFGTCCLENESRCICRVLTAEVCAERGGVWTPGGECTVESCDCEEQACCLPDGGCRLFDPVQCDDAGGEIVGIQCLPNPCDSVGACCLEGFCETLSEVQCVERGGTFRGARTSCGSIECQETCSPLSTPGANTLSNFGNPNAGGTLILHHDPDLVLSSGPLSYCSEAAAGAAQDVTTRVDIEESAVFFVLAAFPEDSQPDLVGVEFGIYYPDCIAVLDEGSCGDVDVGLADWPSSGSGTSILWSHAQQERMVTVHWFEAEIAPGLSALFELGPRPGGRGVFLDSNQELVAIEDFGSIGFHSDGFFPRPRPIAAGACCFDSHCELLERLVCESRDGAYQGPGSACEPETCARVPTIESSWGQIKARFSGPR